MGRKRERPHDDLSEQAVDRGSLMFFYTHLETPAGRRPAFSCLEFDDLEGAYIDACASLPDLARELLREGVDPARCALTICGMQNELLLKVRLSDIIRHDPQARSSLLPDRRAATSIVEQLRETDAKARIVRKELAETLRDSRDLIAEVRRLLSTG